VPALAGMIEAQKEKGKKTEKLEMFPECSLNVP
jgi:hypothetical protein